MPIKPNLRFLYSGPEYDAKRRASLERAGAKFVDGTCVKPARCQKCDREDGTPYQNRFGKWIATQLGRAHLDQNPHNDADENIAMLCRACHMEHDLPAHVASAADTRKTKKDAARPLLQTEGIV